MSAGKPTFREGYAATLAMLAMCAAILVWLLAGNPRLLASWHGFLHAGIATSFARSFPPENPFFAGEPLPYYWFYHFAGYWLSHALHLNLLLTFQIVSWVSLAVLVIVAGMIGRRCFRSAFSGVAIAYLALCGLNPLGPVIALTKSVTRGEALVQHWNGPVENTFVSNQQADRLMTQPLLGAMYVGNDWRQGPDLVWFFDIGSRAPALAGLLLLLYLFLEPEPSLRRVAVVLLVSLLVTALNPLIGLAVAGALGVASLLRRQRTPFLLSVACGAGALLASPTYYQMFFRVSGGSGVMLRTVAGPLIVAVNFAVLAGLAFFGARKAANQPLTVVAWAGMVLLALLAVVHLPEGNEHNLGNAAQFLLAIPAGACLACLPRPRAALFLAIFVPVTAGTLYAYANRPPMPIAISADAIVRTAPVDLDRFYDWIRRETPSRSVFIADPATPVKMSGNASELPAMTSRALFTDLPNYLTRPNPDFAFRTQLAVDAAQGRELTAPQREYLQRLNRPTYLISYKLENRDRLATLYGAPVFQNTTVAVFASGVGLPAYTSERSSLHPSAEERR
jgi:hypothetical protein